MSALTIFNNRPPVDTGDEFFGAGNIKERVTVPSVTYGGKQWTVNFNGQKHILTRTDENGDDVPLSTMRVVILDYAARLARAYYPGEYDPEKPGQPECWSDDGRTPHAAVTEPKSQSCETCPLAVKGSKITAQGKQVAACSMHRMIVVIPAENFGKYPPLRLKLAVTSNYDAKSPDLEAQGWFAFHQYTELLRTQGVSHSGRLVTKMKFDPNVVYPKVIFSPDRWLEHDEKAIVGPMSQRPEVKELLSGTWTPAGADGVKAIAAPQVVIPPAQLTVKPAVAAVVDDEDEAPVVAVKKAAPKKVVVEDDDIVVPLKKAKTLPKVEPVEMSEDALAALVGEWD